MQAQRVRGTFIIRVIAQEKDTIQGMVEHVQSGLTDAFKDESELIEIIKSLAADQPTKE